MISWTIRWKIFENAMRVVTHCLHGCWTSYFPCVLANIRVEDIFSTLGMFLAPHMAGIVYIFHNRIFLLQLDHQGVIKYDCLSEIDVRFCHFFFFVNDNQPRSKKHGKVLGCWDPPRGCVGVLWQWINLRLERMKPFSGGCFHLPTCLRKQSASSGWLVNLQWDQPYCPFWITHWKSS